MLAAKATKEALAQAVVLVPEAGEAEAWVVVMVATEAAALATEEMVEREPTALPVQLMILLPNLMI